ncbi:MAG: AAA family ATPase [Methylicorpusculum sp.]|nr:AAA family ATPase [Methylicorpusculum sp.]MDZ4153940.1 AAA family ATPase [Methylicorpusculum sp.]
MGTGLDKINKLLEHTERLRRSFRNFNFSPDNVKRDERRYSLKEAQELVGRSYQAIRDAENDGRLCPPEIGANGRRVGFTLSQINKMRDIFGTRLHRGKNDDPVILAIQNFKGGVSKSTVACHLAEYLAKQGYSVLLIDCDSQASSTTTFGYIPDDDIDENETLLPFFREEAETLAPYIRKTYWDSLDIIPSNLMLYQAEYELASNASAGSFTLLKEGIETIQDNYDVIIMDPAPALGMISLNVIYAANALIIPMPPAMYDFSSTISFLTMLKSSMESLELHLGPIEYKFVKILISRYDESKSAQQALVDLANDQFEGSVLAAKLRDSAEIASAGNRQRTVYELNGPITSPKVHNRCLTILDSVNKEVELLIRRSWASHSKSLRDAGLD